MEHKVWVDTWDAPSPQVASGSRPHRRQHASRLASRASGAAREPSSRTHGLKSAGISTAITHQAFSSIGNDRAEVRNRCQCRLRGANADTCEWDDATLRLPDMLNWLARYPTAGRRFQRRVWAKLRTSVSGRLPMGNCELLTGEAQRFNKHTDGPHGRSPQHDDSRYSCTQRT